MPVKSIVVDSAPNLPDSDRARLTGPYVGRCLGKAELEKLMAEITAAYLDRGYSTTRVYLPEQDLRTGVLRLQVVEGVVENIIIDDDRFFRVSAATAFPSTIGAPFNLRDFEQGLDQLNRMPANNATLDIQAGTKPGDSVIAIRNQPAKVVPIGVSATGNNQGSTATGRVQDSGTLTLQGVAGINELVTVIDQRSHAYTGDGHDGRLFSLMGSVPFGYNTLTLSGSQSSYATRVQGTGDPFMTTGVTRTGGVVLDRVLARGADYRVSGSTGLTVKHTRSWIQGEPIETASRKMTVFDADLTGNTGLFGDTVTANGGYSRGLHTAGAMLDKADIPPAFPHAEFNKLR